LRVGNRALSSRKPPLRAANHALSALCLVSCSWLYVTAARAQSDTAEWPVDVHAFASQGFILSSKNNYLVQSKRGSAEFTEVGLNVTKTLGDDFRIGAQLFTRKLGAAGNYTPQFDWFYLDYHLWDWLGIRAGRNKIPFGLYNESNDVDAGRVPILLPQSLYPNDHRDYLLAQSGLELYGNISLASLGQLEYRAYGGTIFLDTSQQSKPGVTISNFSVPYVVGGRLMWLTPIEGLQAGASLQALKLDGDYAFSPDIANLLKTAGIAPADFTGKFHVKIPLKLWVASLEYAVHDLLLSAEYGRWIGDVESSAPSVFPNARTVNERYYVMASYHVTPWFTPGAYYSGFFLNMADRTGRQQYQHDVAATLRFDVNPNWLFKLEGHLMRGTAALEGSPNDDKELSKLTRNWCLLMLKTTAYF
jgi:hypothetical protein